jgi:hypothetical protein
MEGQILQFFQVDDRQSLKQLGAAPRQRNLDLSLIAPPTLPDNQPQRLQAIGQPDGAVMFDLKPFGQFAVGDVLPAGKAFDRQERLMLLGGQPDAYGGFRAKAAEAPEFIAERRKRLILGLGQRPLLLRLFRAYLSPPPNSILV